MNCKQCGHFVADDSQWCKICAYPANADFLSQQEKDFDLIPEPDVPNHNPYQAPKSSAEDKQAQAQDYQLWNPNAAAMWGLVFTPIFSAYLQMQNWKALGQLEDAKQSKMWIGIVLVLSIVLSYLPDDMPFVDHYSILILLVWYFANGKKQITFVNEYLQNHYIKRSWLRPILVAILVVMLLFFAIDLIVYYVEPI